MLDWGDSNQFPEFGSIERTIIDNVHGSITFHKNIWKIIDCPEFQRLRDIKQLGVGVDLVFPGSTHTRFEHCIGTAHLAREMINNIRGKQGEKLEITEREVRNVTIAGLLHDLGHAVNSHGFETQVIHKLNPNLSWNHEVASGRLMEYMVEKYSLDFDSEDISQIKGIIKGENIESDSTKNFLYQIVANEKNSVDVDKFDYLNRDSYNVGIKTVHFDYKRLINSCRVLDGNICFSRKNDYNIYGIFQSRYKLFKDIYFNQDSMGIEYMVADALLEANPYFKYLECIEDPDKYLRLTDRILDYIAVDHNPIFRKSQEILKRIKQRDLYRCVGDALISSDQKEKISITPKDIINAGNGFTEEDFEISNFSINYGCKANNPVESGLQNHNLIRSLNRIDKKC